MNNDFTVLCQPCKSLDEVILTLSWFELPLGLTAEMVWEDLQNDPENDPENGYIDMDVTEDHSYENWWFSNYLTDVRLRAKLGRGPNSNELEFIPSEF